VKNHVVTPKITYIKLNLIAPTAIVIGGTLYLVHRVLIAFELAYHGWWIRGYVGDVLALVVCVPLFLSIQSIAGLRLPSHSIKLIDIVLFWFIFSVFFEMVAPMFWIHQTADAWDVVAYALGGAILWILSRSKS
jgi:hypothetical protein